MKKEMKQSSFTKLSKQVGWHRDYHPEPPTDEEINEALTSDNRALILDWWRHCQAGTISGGVLRSALYEVERRCDQDDRQKDKEELNGRENGKSEGSDSQSVVRHLPADSGVGDGGG